ncbi:hypothetical protein H4683_002784 [Filibacter limicola]|uniref:Type I restriction enzyme HindI endonuclease subunit-like C-terminal domain-containing protein n=1 Tax=Sporosarcina limicola TaxID=34101 RepID=A0A927MJ49_9BACL|nr:hypothetical protein [Sporosarcina limicola]
MISDEVIDIYTPLSIESPDILILSDGYLEEVAFYDALASHDTAEQVLGDDILKVIAHELTKAIKENMSIDWNLRDSARAKMRITVRRLLGWMYRIDLRPWCSEMDAGVFIIG